jgi:hypothetical protein
MAEYFRTREDAEEFMNRWYAQSKLPVFFGRILLAGGQQWMVTYDARQSPYLSGAIQVLTDHSHEIGRIVTTPWPQRQRELQEEPIKERRRAQGLCVMCGNGLGFVSRLFGKTQHGGCTKFLDTKPDVAVGAEEAPSAPAAGESFWGLVQSVVRLDLPAASLRDGVPPSDLITWDNSETLREASGLAGQPGTRNEAIRRLEGLCDQHPASDAPYTLLAEALRRDGSYEKAEALLLRALTKVPLKSEILDELRNVFDWKGDHRKAAAYGLLAVYAMASTSTAWGTLLYLHGVYQALGRPEASAQCRNAAAAMRGSAVDLTAENFGKIREAISSDTLIKSIAQKAWDEFLPAKVLQFRRGS